MKAPFEVFYRYHGEPVISEVVWCDSEGEAEELCGLTVGEQVIDVSPV